MESQAVWQDRQSKMGGIKAGSIVISDVDRLQAILGLSQDCSIQGHVHCSSSLRCQELGRSAADEIAAFQKAAQFHLIGDHVRLGEEGPTASSPTAALFECVASAVLSPPWSDPLKRSVWATSALARLAERGIPADAVVRRHLARPLHRRIALNIATTWNLIREHGSREGLPWELTSWVDEFEAATDFGKKHPDAKLMDVVTEVLTGEFRKQIDNWLQTAAVAHIVGWRAQDYLTVDVPTDVLTVSGGISCSQWIFDRFTKNYLHEWENESVAWELSFALSPEETASRAGVSNSWLQERAPSSVLAQAALIRQHTLWQREPDIILSGTTEAHVIEDILYLVNNDALRAAQEYAAEACERNPGSSTLRRLSFFTRIPSDPAEALEFYLSDSAMPDPWLRYINLASCAIALDDMAGVRTHLQNLSECELEGKSGWLWAPDIEAGKANLRTYSAVAWLAEASAVLDAL